MDMATATHCLIVPCKPRNPFLLNLAPPPSELNLLTIRSLNFPSNLSHNLFSKGCLSMSNVERPIRQLVVCMARRYGSNTRKRKIKSRKRGGDPEKKRRRKRKSTRRKKDKIKLVRLVSAVRTGYVYTKVKGKQRKMEKLEIKKYDPNVKRHVLFIEAK